MSGDEQDDTQDARNGAAAADAPDAASEPSGLDPVPEDALTALTRERDELRDQLLRRRAEFENYRRRVERDRHVAAQEATADTLKLLIPTLDDLERALAAAADDSPLRQGVELIRRRLLSTLEAQGVTVSNPIGERFDPNVHQALAYEAVPGAEDGTIVEVFGKGFQYKDRLLRAAMVKVAKAGSTPSADKSTPEAVH